MGAGMRRFGGQESDEGDHGQNDAERGAECLRTDPPRPWRAAAGSALIVGASSGHVRSLEELVDVLCDRGGVCPVQVVTTVELNQLAVVEVSELECV